VVHVQVADGLDDLLGRTAGSREHG